MAKDIEELYAGVRHFEDETFSLHRDEFRALANSQNPGTLFITCSDSRIVPSLITGTGPGALFVVRNPGNIVPAYGTQASGESAAIEFALEVLAVKRIVVCGHTDCGAMKALLDRDTLEGLPMMRSWLSRCGDVGARPGEGLDALIRRNVRAQLDNLRSYPAVASREATGSVLLHGWLYNIAAGRVLVFDAAEGKFRSLPRTSAAA